MSARKPPEQRRGKAGTTIDIDPALIASGPVPTPPMPEHPMGRRFKWKPVSVEAWEALWSARAAPAFNSGHTFALRRYIDMIERRERHLAKIDKAPVVTASNGKVVKHPLLGEVGRLDAEIRHLEASFGLTLKSELALGLSVAKGSHVAAQAAAAARDAGGAMGRTDEHFEDPRYAPGDPRRSASWHDSP